MVPRGRLAIDSRRRWRSALRQGDNNASGRQTDTPIDVQQQALSRFAHAVTQAPERRMQSDETNPVALEPRSRNACCEYQRVVVAALVREHIENRTDEIGRDPR